MDAIMKQALAHRSRRTAIALGVALLASGCDLRHAPILDPKGPIALAERDLLFTAVVLMLIVIIPVFVMTFLFAWRYRSSNGKARYTPDWSYSARIDAVIWLVPALIVIALGVLVWSNTHKLDPYRPIDSAVPPLEVEVVAQDWKWLFIYPEQEIAVVNQLVFPSQRPLSLKITSDTVMNSFFIPALGGQIYAMAGMQTRLQLLADAPGAIHRQKHPIQRGRLFRSALPGNRRVAGRTSMPGWQRSSNRRASWMQPPIARLPCPAAPTR